MSDFAETAEDLYEHAPCGYLSARPDGTIVRVNETFLRWTGYHREDLVDARRFQDLLTVGGRIYHETHYAPLLRMQGAVREIAVDLVCASGDRLSVLINSVLLNDASGAPHVVRTTVFDATERKRYEHELLVARDRARTAQALLERLQRITAAAAGARDAETIARAVIDELVAALGADRASVAVADRDSGALLVLARHGSGPETAGPEFDEGQAGVRDAAVRLRLGALEAPRGRLWLAFPGARGFSPEERALLTAAATQTALALERIELHEQTRTTAETLQRSLLAGSPPRDPRFTVTSLYRPADEHLEVGGDWHDAFCLPAGRVGIAVGDVVGRGLSAASAMGQLRSALRALAGAGLTPAEVLRHLDTFVEQAESARYATVAYADVDPSRGRVDFASAGHPPPVLLDPDGTPALFMGGRSTPLGLTVPNRPRDQDAFALPPGSGFLLYTDGLVERREESIDTGLERLLAALRAHPDATPTDLADAIVEQDTHDDICLLLFRRA